MKQALVATFNETDVPTARSYVFEQGAVILNSSDSFQSSWLLSSVSTLESTLKVLISEVFFYFEKRFVDYFPWNACTYLQKICTWTRCNDAKSIADTSVFLDALLCFCFRKVLLNEALVAIFNEKGTPAFGKNATEQDIIMPNLLQPLQLLLAALLRFFLKKLP